MFEQSKQVHRQEMRGFIEIRSNDPQSFVEARIRQTLPQHGADYKLEINRSGNVANWVAVRQDKP